MNETQLQIVISLINDASTQLAEVGEQLSSLGTTASEAASEMTSSLTEAEQAAADAAMAAAQQWEDFGTTAATATDEAANGIQDSFMSISDASLAAANASSEGWQNSLAELQDMMAQATATTEDDFAAMSESASSSASSMGGTFGYFHNLILGMLAERAGSGITGAVQDIVSAASGVPNQIAQLTAQINQQKADIATNEAALQKWVGTTLEVAAAHEKARANIEAETVKIAELTRQVQPLEAAQQASGDAATQYLAAVQQLTTDWQALLSTIGTPFITALTNQIAYIDEIVKKMQEWAQAHPELAKEIMTFLAVLGPALTLLGELAIAWAIISLALTAAAGPFLLAGAAIAVVTAAVIAFWPQIKGVLDDINAKTGFIDTLRAAWEKLSSDFETKLLPDLEKLWKDLQPLMPYLEDFAAFVGGVLLTAIVSFADGVLKVADGFAQLLDYATRVADFLTTHLEPVLNTIKGIMSEFGLGSAGQAIGGAMSAASPSLMSALGSMLLSGIPGFASGGIVDSPTLAMVGEAGPEAIIPLSAFSGGSSLAGAGGFGGGGIVINIQGGTYLDQNGASTIAQALATQIGRQLKLKNYF